MKLIKGLGFLLGLSLAISGCALASAEPYDGVPTEPAAVEHADAESVPGSKAPDTSVPKRPKNVIVMIGDGMGYAHLDMANAYLTGRTAFQISGKAPRVTANSGKTGSVLDSFPVRLSASTYAEGGSYDPGNLWRSVTSFRNGPTDSAAAATALATGTKTVKGALGVDASGAVVANAIEVASKTGKATGLVSSVPFSHATPAGFAVHLPDRNKHHLIAKQILDSDVDFVMTPGHPFFDSAGRKLAKPSYTYVSGSDYQRLARGQTKFQFVSGTKEIKALAKAPVSTVGEVKPVFGLVSSQFTLQKGRPGVKKGVRPFSKKQLDLPSLADMSLAALNSLAADRDGFFLMVEGGAIDTAAHSNHTTQVVEETVSFLRAISAVDAWVQKNSSWEETVLIVTADHETGFAVGPGTSDGRGWKPIYGKKGQLPKVSWLSGYHSNQLVPVFAKGWASEILVSGAKSDPVRGKYIDNTDLGKAIHNYLN